VASTVIIGAGGYAFYKAIAGNAPVSPPATHPTTEAFRLIFIVAPKKVIG